MNPVNEHEQDVQVGDKLVEIGHILAVIIRGEPEGAYLYAEADHGWADVAIFEHLNDRLLFWAPNSELFEAVRQLWGLFPPTKRWTSLGYQILGGRFNVSFDYDEIDADDGETSIDRREIRVRALFGDKPIDYSDTGRDQDFVSKHCPGLDNG